MIHNLNIQDFLENYWQKKPLLIRSAFPNYQSPLSAEELAGLACEDFVQSRIISEQPTSPKWTLNHGPFSEEHFPDLPETHWTLLIQGLNKLFPKFDDLLHEFNFIPSWRVDDLMASYAVPKGSVGPHIDQYDVFLLQATGRRKWMINQEAITADNFEADLPLKIIKNFTSESEWILEAGDMLYLPPNVAHHGIAMEDCMTFSIGFRAPSHAELLTSFLDEHITLLSDEQRYKDPKLSYLENSGEISSTAINKVQQILLSHFDDRSNIEDWFGRFITEYLIEDNVQEENCISDNEFLDILKNCDSLRRPATIRANYIRSANKLSLYINGNSYPLEAEEYDIATLFCDQHVYPYKILQPYIKSKVKIIFFRKLYNLGYLELESEL